MVFSLAVMEVESFHWTSWALGESLQAVRDARSPRKEETEE